MGRRRCVAHFLQMGPVIGARRHDQVGPRYGGQQFGGPAGQNRVRLRGLGNQAAHLIEGFFAALQDARHATRQFATGGLGGLGEIQDIAVFQQGARLPGGTCLDGDQFHLTILLAINSEGRRQAGSLLDGPARVQFLGVVGPTDGMDLDCRLPQTRQEIPQRFLTGADDKIIHLQDARLAFH